MYSITTAKPCISREYGDKFWVLFLNRIICALTVQENLPSKTQLVYYIVYPFWLYHEVTDSVHVQWSTLLYFTVLYFTVLYCTVLYGTVLYCKVLHCTVLYCIVLYCTVLFCTVGPMVLFCAKIRCLSKCLNSFNFKIVEQMNIVFYERNRLLLALVVRS